MCIYIYIYIYIYTHIYTQHNDKPYLDINIEGWEKGSSGLPWRELKPTLPETFAPP